MTDASTWSLDWAEDTGLAEGDRIRIIEWYVDPELPEAEDSGIILDADRRCIGYDDNRIVPPGTCGTVDLVDACNIRVKWDNGSGLGLSPQDRWLKVTSSSTASSP